MKSLLPDAFQGVEMNLCSPMWLRVSINLLILLPSLHGTSEDVRAGAGHLNLAITEGRLLNCRLSEKGLLTYS